MESKLGIVMLTLSEKSRDFKLGEGRRILVGVTLQSESQRHLGRNAHSP